MTTVVNSPVPSQDTGYGFLIGILVLGAFGLLFFYYGLPALRNMGPVKVEVGTPEIVVPNSIDVNVKPAQ
ncbi:MAG: hypothetical protein WC069_03965 [Candidatus Shapirobacteria bacterium]